MLQKIKILKMLNCSTGILILAASLTGFVFNPYFEHVKTTLLNLEGTGSPL